MKPTGIAYRIPRNQPVAADPRVRARRRKLTLGASVIAIVLLCILFPRLLTFAGLAAREIRFFWRFIAVLAIVIWIASYLRKKRG